MAEETVICDDECIRIGDETYNFSPIRIMLFEKWILEGMPLNWKVSTVTRVTDKKSKNYGLLVKGQTRYYPFLYFALEALLNNMNIGKPKILDNGNGGERKKIKKDKNVVNEQSFDEAVSTMKKLMARVKESENTLIEATKPIIKQELLLQKLLERTSILSDTMFRTEIQKLLRKTGAAKVTTAKKRGRKKKTDETKNDNIGNVSMKPTRRRKRRV